MENKRIILNGVSEYELRRELRRYVKDESINILSKYLPDLYNLDDEDNTFYSKITYPKTQPNVLCLLVPNTSYFVNVKYTTITLIALLLELKITNTFLCTLVSQFKTEKKWITKISEIKGEKCMVLEVILNKKKGISFNNILKNCKGECVNNHLKNCKYRSNDLCEITKDAKKQILDDLTGKNVLIKKDGLYRIAI